MTLEVALANVVCSFTERCIYITALYQGSASIDFSIEEILEMLSCCLNKILIKISKIIIAL